MCSNKSIIVELVLTDGTRNDITDAKESLDCIGTGDLIIRDLGYCSLAVIEGIKQGEAFFVYRLMLSLSVFDFHGEEINFKRIYEKMRKYSIPYKIRTAPPRSMQSACEALLRSPAEMTPPACCFVV